MQIEQELFERTHVNFSKLKEYGFEKKKDCYYYSKILLDNFKVDIVIDKKGLVTGKIYDLIAEEEYINFRIESQVGKFVSSIREAYRKLLEDIRINCFQKEFFVSDQANRITNKIIDLYHDEPDFAWESAPGHGIFRNPQNDKWYALIMHIDRNKIDKTTTGKVEAINLKLSPATVCKLQQEKGFYEAYHMNKKNWITIILDNTIADERVIDYIKESHKFTETSSTWLLHANPKFYDIIACFNKTDTILWKQPNNIKVKDKVYIYVGIPYKAILYQCEVTEVDISYQYQDQNLLMTKAMKIKRIKQYKKEEYPFDKLKKYGVKSIRGPRHIPEKLEQEMNKRQ